MLYGLCLADDEDEPLWLSPPAFPESLSPHAAPSAREAQANEKRTFDIDRR